MPAEAYLVVSALLLGTGLAGVIARGNAVSMLVGTQLMLDAAILAVVVAARRGADASGELTALAFIVAGAASLAVGLAMIMDVTRRGLGADIDRGAGDP